MEPAHTKIMLGDFRVIERKFDGIRIDLGKQVTIWIHLGDFPHNVKPGDTLPLFTEIAYAIPKSTPVE
jgi:hypothetical protein